MKKTMYLLFLLTGFSNVLFGSSVRIDDIFLRKNNIEIVAKIDLDNQNEIPTKLILERKINNDPWIEVHEFNDPNNLKFLDYDVINGAEYAYRLRYNNQIISSTGEVLELRSSNEYSELRTKIFWTAPEPDLYFQASDYGLTNNKRYDAFVSVYLSGSNEDKIVKPLFILDGFDPSNARSVFNNATSNFDGRGLYHLANGDQIRTSHFYDANEPASLGLIDEFKSRCYDIIFIDWIEGAGDVIQNSELFENIIEHFNQIKSSGNKNVVLGPSMGGLIARYALADMEEKGINHDFKLFISLDSPHEGANIPLGVQELLNRADNNSVVNLLKEKEIKQVMNALNSKAALQMSFYHHIATNYYSPRIPRHSVEFTKFFKKLKELNGGVGWPTNCFKVGISNGSGDNKDRHFVDNKNFIGIGNSLIYGKVYPVSNPNGLIVKTSTDYKLKVPGLQIDNAPGGFSDIPYIFNKFSINPDTKNNNDKNCFIPVPSSLGLPITQKSLNYNWIWNKSFEQLELTKSELDYYGFKTPFDVCMVQDKNQQHVFIGKNTRELTLKYLDRENVTDIIIPHQPSVEVIDEDRTEEGVNIQICDPLKTRELTVVPNVSFFVFAEESINWFPGFTVELGAQHVSMIVDSIQTSCMINSSNKRSFEGVVFEEDEETKSNDALKLSFKTQIMPNPTKGKISILISDELTEDSKLEIIDSRGRILKTYIQLNKKIHLDLSEFENGIYYIKIKDAGNVQLKKVIKI